ncbi:hypothetical protein [Loktanella sp. S4079]|uniref:hypothetical protein n=1 Tax=Loktanella sp. S4079 TaxID=579483 RepID=UPI0005FA0A83|nr:hypothetical protein [Loktanella sp. S4079]KJZ19916.1 hypothetical protein TW80_03325 [Loktanella sp. S4079]
MNNIFKTLSLVTFMLSGQAILATPLSDARYIAQRDLDHAALSTMQRLLKGQFVNVYLRPFSGLGIEVIDEDRFIDLIPDEDVAPFLDHYLAQSAENYLSIYTPEQLASMATLLRTNDDASMEEILSEEYRRELEIAVEKARTTAQPSGSDDPLVLGLEEMIVQLEAINVMLDGDGAEAIAQHFTASIAPLFMLMRYSREISQLERDFDNPVTIAVLNEHGILRFANPVQRQTLLRQLSASKDTGGIQFITPPRTTETD